MVDDELARHDRNLVRLGEGITDVRAEYGRYVDYEDGDTSAFSGGHYMFYQSSNPERRFVIEETEFFGTEDTNPEMIPSEYSWREETLVESPDGKTRHWQVSSDGTVDSDGVESMLGHLRQWAQAVRTADRREAMRAPFTAAGHDRGVSRPAQREDTRRDPQGL